MLDESQLCSCPCDHYCNHLRCLSNSRKCVNYIGTPSPKPTGRRLQTEENWNVVHNSILNNMLFMDKANEHNKQGGSDMQRIGVCKVSAMFKAQLNMPMLGKPCTFAATQPLWHVCSYDHSKVTHKQATVTPPHLSASELVTPCACHIWMRKRNVAALGTCSGLPTLARTCRSHDASLREEMLHCLVVGTRGFSALVTSSGTN